MDEHEVTAKPSGLAGTTPLAMAAAEESAVPAPRSEDAPWATTFGAIDVADHPTVIAVRGEEVYVGGDFFTQMAGLPEYTYIRVAHWDGSSWRRMGAGVDSRVNAIAVVGDEVYVGGDFGVADATVEASRLARWDGSAWSAVAGGVSSSQPASPASVRALACDGARLYVAGAFDSVGSGDGAVAANGLAALDLRAGTWETYDGGLFYGVDPGEGRALTLVRDRLYVGGSFDRAGAVETGSLAALDLTTGRWERFGAGVRNGDFVGTVDSLATDEATDTVYLGGRFTAAGNVPTSGVATLCAGRFASLGALTYNDDPMTANVVALAHAGERLYAAGTFDAAGGVAVEHWAEHDGTSWSVPVAVDNAVAALAAYGEGVVVTGLFGHSGALRMPHAGIWTGAGWQTFGQGLAHDAYADGYVNALVATQGGVFAGGFFDQVGPVRVGSVAQWRDGAWQDMAGGVQMPHVLGTVQAMLGVGSDLYVTGQFEAAGEVGAASIARWDGARWSSLGAGIGGVGAALVMLGDRLYVGGSFFAAGGTPAYNVASWDPATGAWGAVGSNPSWDGGVSSLAVLSDRYLVIGGSFGKLYAGRFQVSGLNSLVLFDTHAPAQPANPWAGYSRLPGVTNSWGAGAVHALRVLGDDLYVGGTFDRAGVEAWADPPVEGFAASNLAVWPFRPDPGSWSTPGATDQPVHALATLDGRSLLVGGSFASAGATAASGVVEHDPASGTWTPYGSGVGWGARGGPNVRALAQSATDGLWVGGSFTVAGGAPSCSLALWRDSAGRAP